MGGSDRTTPPLAPWPDWSKGATLIVAGGPSLRQSDIEALRPAVRRTVVINNSHELAPWADTIYAADWQWWECYGERVTIADRWTLWPTLHGVNEALSIKQAEVIRRFGLNAIDSENGKGLGRKRVHWGGHSGYQAINLAYLFGARTILLLGYDMQMVDSRTHWHGDHPTGMKTVNPQALRTWAERMKPLEYQLRRAGVSVVNASRSTALTFQRKSVEECVQWLVKSDGCEAA